MYRQFKRPVAHIQHEWSLKIRTDHTQILSRDTGVKVQVRCLTPSKYFECVTTLGKLIDSANSKTIHAALLSGVITLEDFTNCSVSEQADGISCIVSMRMVSSGSVIEIVCIRTDPKSKLRSRTESESKPEVGPMPIIQVPIKTIQALDKAPVPSKIKAWFSNINYSGWTASPDPNWKTMKFNQFRGTETLRSDLSTITITEDGVYVIRVHYHWRASDVGVTAPYTAIFTNNTYFSKQHHLDAGFTDNGWMEHTMNLSEGDIVETRTNGHATAEQYLNNFAMEIEKLQFV